MNSNRRSFFKAVGAVAAASVAANATTQKVLAGPTLPPDGRFFKTSRSILEIDNDPVGELESVKGGYPFGAVIAEPPTPDGVVPKHLGEIQFENLVATAGAGMEKKFYTQLTDFLNRTPPVFNGAISYSDAKFREGGRLEFTDAAITELRFPELDASARAETGALTVIYSLGASTRVKGDVSKQTPPEKSRGKSLLTSNFRVSIDGTGEAMAQVSRVEPMIFRQEIRPRTDRAGIVLEAGPLEVGDLVITTSELASEPLYEWFARSVEAGGRPDERNGKIEFLGSDRTSVIFTLNLFNLGIYWLATEDGDASVLRRVTAKLYCERAAFAVVG